MKKKMKAGLVAIVAIAAVMMFSSYAAALSQDEIEGLILNASEVDTYKFDMNTTMTMTMTTEMLMGNETNATEPMVMVGNGSGVVDNINKSMMMAMSMCMNMSEIMGDENTEDLSSQWAGQWEGTTSQGKAVSFEASDTHISTFRITYGNPCDVNQIHFTNYIPIDIVENVFQYEYLSDFPYKSGKWIYGKFTSPSFATGTFRHMWEQGYRGRLTIQNLNKKKPI